MTRAGRWKWWVAALIALLLAGLLGRTLLARRAESSALAAAPRPPAALDLAASDYSLAAPRELLRRLDITGELKAVDSAVVKAKVAGELQQLTVREGDRVAAGQLLGRIDATEYALRLRQAEQQSAQALAQLEIAERALDNNRALVDQGFISKNALDTSVSNAAAARASLQAARAAADLARKAQADTLLRAPIAGLVSQRLVQPGERVPIDARLVEIVDLTRVELAAALTPEQVGAVRIGAAATLRIDGIAEPVAARVARINPAAQAGTRAVMAYLAVEPHAGLRQGLFATGRIELDRKTALAVPAEAVRIDQARPLVLSVAEGRIVARPVRLGLRGEAAGEPMVEVLEGLAAGDPVLRKSVGLLREGTPVALPGPPEAAANAASLSPAAAR